jgi:two-component system nitrogen regulation sensor histidine kinase NtrY
MRWRVSHENRILVLASAAAAPALVAALLLLWLGDFSTKVQWTVALLVMLWFLGFGLALRERVMRPLQTLSNLIAALSEGDFSIRARGARPDEALGLALFEVNQLTETLREQRVGAVEATALLRKVMEEIDVAVLAFDGDERVRAANRGAARLFGATPATMLRRDAESLGVRELLEGPTPRVIEGAFKSGGRRWELRRSAFRLGGRPHSLVVLSDLSRTLREEELQAWKRLVRVLSHEINNSLAPIRSMSESLRSGLRRSPRHPEWETDAERALDVIGGRADALIRFMQSYARLARLPPPRRRPVQVGAWIRRVARLEARLPVEVIEGPDVVLQADGDQLEQLLINLVGNGVDAALETGGGVRVEWAVPDHELEVRVEDDGPGLADTTNLFVPFFTTKPSGSGIGLVLSRQIAEAHGGAVWLVNRTDRSGCVAHVRLPLG